jgi:perosamine synthetase
MQKKYQIPVAKPHLTKEDFLEIKKCFDSSWISSQSPWVEKFEKLFAKTVSHTKYAVSVNSGTSGLFLALKSLGIGPGDEVIIPALTMIATINAVGLTGAKPVLVDSTSKDDWNIDPEKIVKKITRKTKAIMPVQLYGYPCNMDAIMQIAKKHKLFVVEDSAEAMGSVYKSKAVGSIGDVSCFSLYTNKVITTGNGGIICTNNKKLNDTLKQIRFFDYNPGTHFIHYLIGYNLVLSGIQSALGYSQLKKYQQRLKKRRQVFFWFKNELRHAKIRYVEPLENTNPNYWFTAIILDSEKSKRKVIQILEKNSIEPREFFFPIHFQPVYKKTFAGEKYPLAEYFYRHGLLLTSYFDLSRNDIRFISSTILSALN